MKFTKIKLGLLAAMTLCFVAITNAAPLSGLQECQAIKNSAKKAECFDKLTQKMIQEEAARAESEKNALEEKKIEKAQKILQIMRRVQTRVQTGVSYRDYPSVISDPKFEVQSYIRQSGNEIPEFAKNISNAIDYYDAAGKIWSFKFGLSFVTETTCSAQQENFVKEILQETYVPLKSCGESRCICSGFPISLAMQQVWARATQSIDAADKAIQAKNLN